MSLKQGQYVELVHWTYRQIRPDKTGAIRTNVPDAFGKTGCDATHWATQVKAVDSGYWRMIETIEQLMEKAEAIGQRWLKGIGISRQLQKA